MNIKSVETIILKSDLDTPFAFSQGWVGKRVCTLVKITTDEGLVGWGEGFAQGLEPPEILARCGRQVSWFPHPPEGSGSIDASNASSCTRGRGSLEYSSSPTHA